MLHKNFSLKNLLSSPFKRFVFLEYKCSMDNTCSGHGECMDVKDNGWCICRPGWTSKEDCSGN